MSPFQHHALASAALAALSAGAFAQTTSSNPPGQLQTIQITAERRLQNIQEVPVSASVLQSELLDAINTGGQDLRGLSGRAPGLNIESSFGRAFPRFYIRGYGNTDFRLNASQPVSLVYDDVVQESPILKGFPAFDLERVEVLRGPQGSLFGRNTPAGVVKFDSVQPSRRTEGYGSISYGRFRTINAEGAANVAIGPMAAVRLSVLNQTRDDWVENGDDTGPTEHLEGYRDSALRAQALVTPLPGLAALVNFHLRDFKGSSRVFRANAIEPGTNDRSESSSLRNVAYDGKNRSEVQNYGGNARINWNLGPVTLHSITGYELVRTYSRGDIDGGTAPYVFSGGAGSIPFLSETADGMPSHHQWTQELRVESNGQAAFGWQAGLYAFREDYRIESFSYDSSNAGAQDGYLRVKQNNNAYAAFGAVTYAPLPALKLRGGLRYTWDKKKFGTEAYSNSTFASCIAGGLCTIADLAAAEPDGQLGAGTNDKKLSWDASVAYAVDRNVNVYVRAAKGFRGSSIQGASGFNTKSVAGPETNTSFEVGVKADLLDRRARVNLSVFDYTVRDLQLTAVGGTGNANILLNADKAKGRGAELDVQALLHERVLASAGVGYTRAKIDDAGLSVSPCGTTQYVFGQPGAPRPNCTVTDPLDASGKALIDGNQLPQAPKFTANFTLRVTQPVGAGEAYAYTDWVYRGKVNFFLYDSVEFTGKPLTEGGLRLGYMWGNGKYDAAAYVRNITNQVRIVGGIDFDNLTGFTNDPRTYGVQFKANF